MVRSELPSRPKPKPWQSQILNPLARPGIKPASQRSKATADPILPQRELLFRLFFCLLGPCLWHMEVPRLGVETEL